MNFKKLYFDTGNGSFLIFMGVQDKNIFRFLWEHKMGEKIVISKKEYQNIRSDNFEKYGYLSQDGGVSWIMV